MKNSFRKFPDKLKRTCFYCGIDTAVGVLTFKDSNSNQTKGDEVRICSKCLPLHITYRKSRIPANPSQSDTVHNKKASYSLVKNEQNGLENQTLSLSNNQINVPITRTNKE